MNETLIDLGHTRLKRCRYGPMLYLTTDSYVGRSLDRYGEFSEQEVEMLRQIVQPRQLVVEVGANIGTHTVFLAQAVGPQGRVVAFEPQRVVYQMLCANLALNGLQNVLAHHAAVGQEPGSVVVPSIDYSKSGNFGGLSLGEYTSGEEVSQITIDGLGLPACHVLKVDVEGMEVDVLRGAEQTIGRYRPLLYVENDRQDKSAALIKQILGLQYRLYWHLPFLYNQANHFGETENVFPGVVSVNMLAVPAAAPQNIQGLPEITSPDADWNDVYRQ